MRAFFGSYERPFILFGKGALHSTPPGPAFPRRRLFTPFIPRGRADVRFATHPFVPSNWVSTIMHYFSGKIKYFFTGHIFHF
jgi:hypothetical protein